MSSFYCISLVFGLLAILARVDAHGHLSVPKSRESALRFDEQNAPVSYPLGQDFICKNRPASPKSDWATLTAGQSVDISWALEAAHTGDCFAYLSYDVDKSDKDMKWFKVAEFPNCYPREAWNQKFTLPAYLPSCEHCVLRWEWYATHVVPADMMEFYSNCADVKIVGKTGGQLPTPQVTIPGHLPMSAKFYRNPDVRGAAQITSPTVGPPVATIGGAAYDCAKTYDDSCTIQPVTKSPCTLSHQRCTGPSTFQACGIGIGQMEWKAEQSCQAGLVCRMHSNGIQIMCDWPSSTPVVSTPPVVVATPPVVVATPPVVVPTPPVVVVTPPATRSTTGKPASASASTSTSSSSNSNTCTPGFMKCATSETYQSCPHGVWSSPQSCQAGLNCKPNGNVIYCVRP